MTDQPERQVGGDPLENPSEEVRATSSSDPTLTNSTSTNRDTGGELLDELRELGNQLEAAFRAALESERTKQLQRDLMGGIKELSIQVKNALRTAQDDPRVQQAGERGREVLRNAQQSKTAHDLQEALVTGVTQLNLQVRKLVERLETADTTSSTTTPTQQVPIDQGYEPASTGETTRLEEGDSTGTAPSDPRD